MRLACSTPGSYATPPGGVWPMGTTCFVARRWPSGYKLTRDGSDRREERSLLSFGVCFMADPPVSRVVELTKLAEDSGFDHAWIWDSHVLWEEVYPIFALQAAATSRIRLGPCVTNPATRDPTVTASALATLNEISGGRMDCG